MLGDIWVVLSVVLEVFSCRLDVGGARVVLCLCVLCSVCNVGVVLYVCCVLCVGLCVLLC